jgi:molybdopterin-guanine dinucleotide biosynthesis protein A
VDMPLIERTHLEWMLDQLADSLGVITSHDDRVEPFPSAFSTSAVHAIRTHLAENRGVYQLIKLEGFKCLPAPPSWPTNIWTNLNTPSDLRGLT